MRSLFQGQVLVNLPSGISQEQLLFISFFPMNGPYFCVSVIVVVENYTFESYSMVTLENRFFPLSPGFTGGFLLFVGFL